MSESTLKKYKNKIFKDTLLTLLISSVVFFLNLPDISSERLVEMTFISTALHKFRLSFSRFFKLAIKDLLRLGAF